MDVRGSERVADKELEDTSDELSESTVSQRKRDDDRGLGDAWRISLPSVEARNTTGDQRPSSGSEDQIPRPKSASPKLPSEGDSDRTGEVGVTRGRVFVVIGCTPPIHLEGNRQQDIQDLPSAPMLTSDSTKVVRAKALSPRGEGLASLRW